MEDLATTFENDSMSTAYSGVGAPETAFKVMKYRLEQRLGRALQCRHQSPGHMVEWNREFQAECLLAADGECVFSDISQFWRPELKRSVIPELLSKPAMAMQVLSPVIMSGNAVQLTDQCIKHGKMRCLRTCQRHVAGTSCKGFSKRGVRLGCTDADAVHFLAWVSASVLSVARERCWGGL